MTHTDYATEEMLEQVERVTERLEVFLDELQHEAPAAVAAGAMRILLRYYVSEQRDFRLAMLAVHTFARAISEIDPQCYVVMEGPATPPTEH